MCVTLHTPLRDTKPRETRQTKNEFLSLLFLLFRDECDTFYDSPFSEREENVDDDDDESKVAS